MNYEHVLAIAKVIKRAAQIREESWTSNPTEFHTTGHYRKLESEAVEDVILEYKLPMELIPLCSIVLIAGWNDILLWCDSVINNTVEADYDTNSWSHK